MYKEEAKELAFAEDSTVGTDERIVDKQGRNSSTIKEASILVIDQLDRVIVGADIEVITKASS
jgi:hypothetical protein